MMLSELKTLAHTYHVTQARDIDGVVYPVTYRVNGAGEMHAQIAQQLDAFAENKELPQAGWEIKVDGKWRARV